MTTESNEWQMPPEDPESASSLHAYAHLPLEDQPAAILRDLEEAQQEAKQNLDMAQRAQAELVNYKRRADEERISISKFSNSRLITKMLPVKEDLDLAINHLGETEANASWLEGVKLIQRKLLTLLESEGVELIDGRRQRLQPYGTRGAGDRGDHRISPRPHHPSGPGRLPAAGPGDPAGAGNRRPGTPIVKRK